LAISTLFAPFWRRTGTTWPSVTAFVCGGRFEHEAVASLLLERSIALDADLGEHVEEAWAASPSSSILVGFRAWMIEVLYDERQLLLPLYRKYLPMIAVAVGQG